MKDVNILVEKNQIKAEFTKKFMKELSKNVARRVAEELYYEMLFLRYLPEIKAIEKGKIKALKDEEVEKLLLDLIKSSS
jgi:hypothetical protein